MNEPPVRNQTESAMAWDDLRTSPSFPAIAGGLAGAVGAAALLVLLSRRNKPKETLPAAYDANGNSMPVVYLPAPKQPRILGFTLVDILTLATIGITLYRQIQDLMQESQMKAEAEAKAEAKAQPMQPQTPPAPLPAPAQTPKPTVK